MAFSVFRGRPAPGVAPGAAYCRAARAFSCLATGLALSVFAAGFPAGVMAAPAVASSGAPSSIADEAALAPLPAQPIVVTATRLETPKDQVGSTVHVITKKDIEARNAPDVAELLRTVPGLHVSRTGGGTTSVFLRGGNSEHVLVLVDGVEMNDPISPARSFDFNELTPESIERIEVVSGPQSTLYGSNAMSGVINIITVKGQGKARGSVHVAAGYPSMGLASAEGSGGADWGSWALSSGYHRSMGLSSAAKRYGNTEKDTVSRGTFAGRFVLTPSDEFDLDVSMRYTRVDLDLDDSGGPGGDDPNHTGTLDRLMFRTGGTLRLFGDLWEQKLVLSMNDMRRTDRDDPDEHQPFEWSRSTFDSRILKADWQHNFNWPPNNTFTVGVSTEEEMGKNRYDDRSPYSSDTGRLTSTTSSLYAQDQVHLWDALTLTAGIRVDDPQNYGTKTTGRLAAAYAIAPTDSVVRASWGTGFKAPSLYQRFSPSGDPNLRPESNTGWDAGITQYLFGKTVTLDATVYYTEYKNMIAYVSDPVTWEGKYYNVNRAKTRGIELAARWDVTEALTFRGGATFSRAKDLDTDKPLLRRPETVYSLGADWKVLPTVTLSADYRHVGKQQDQAYIGFDLADVNLAAYDLVSLSAAWQVHEDLQWYVRLDNLFDQNYEEVWGYETPGFGVTTGVKWQF